ncbi:efflux RND transporter periplasmic adaptor subunit [Schlesneria sp. T3-172]|uniref:efflux RND transporter periplasmic adaptor subunit n=1 Tax=Schlesneria sphaerica TaxID=3373610 RepID=UPI0037C9A8D3
MGQVLLHPTSKDPGRMDAAEPESSPATASPAPHPAPQTPFLRKLAGFLLTCCAFVAGWYVANMQANQHPKETLPSHTLAQERDLQEVVVTAEPVAIRSVQRSVEAFGTLYGFEEVSISARVEGRVRQVLHDVADEVKPSERLLEIDSTDYELAVQQAERALHVELAKLGLKESPLKSFDLGRIPFVAKARSIMEHAKARNDRISRLAASKTVSAEDSENAASEYRTAQAEYENQILQAEMDLATIQLKLVGLDVAREQLANTRVLVPTPTITLPGGDDLTYVIAQRSVSEGTLVRPGSELFRLVINQILKLRVPVPERYSADVRLEQPVNVYTASSRKPITGTVTKIYPTVDATTRSFQVEIQVPNPNGILKPGSFAKAAIHTRIDPEAATVPLTSVVQFAGVTKIFVMEQGKAREIPVTLGTQTTEWVEVVEPELPADARVITSGHTMLADQTPVTDRRSMDDSTTSDPDGATDSKLE